MNVKITDSHPIYDTMIHHYTPSPKNTYIHSTHTYTRTQNTFKYDINRNDEEKQKQK